MFVCSTVVFLQGHFFRANFEFKGKQTFTSFYFNLSETAKFCNVVWRHYLREVGKFYSTLWIIYPRHCVLICIKVGQVL